MPTTPYIGVYADSYGPYQGSGNSVQLPAPTGLAVTAMSGSNGASWNAVTNASSYRLQRAPVSNGTAGSFGTIYEGGDTSYTDATATAGMTYDYRVKALGGNGYLESGYSTAVRVTTASAGTNYQFFHAGDSLVAYHGETGTTNDQTSVPALTTDRLQRAGRAETVSRHGYPGWTAAQFMNETGANPNADTTVKPSGQTALAYLISQFDKTKTIIVEVGFLTNGGEVSDLQALHQALKQAGAAYTFQDLVLNKKGDVPSRAAKNAAIMSGVGVWSNGYTHVNEFPQMYADDAWQNTYYYWSPDFVGITGVHHTTAGNEALAEYSAREFARLAGFVLPVENAGAVAVAENVENDDARVLYPTGTWSGYSLSPVYSSGYGATSADDDASFGLSFLSPAIRLYTPQGANAGSIVLTVTDTNGAIITTKTATQAGSAACKLIAEITGLPAGRKTVTVTHAPGTPTGTLLLSDAWALSDTNGGFLVPAPASDVLITWAPDTIITATDGGNTLTKTGGDGHDNLSVSKLAIPKPTSTTVGAAKMSIPISGGVRIIQGLAYAGSIPAAGSRSYANGDFMLYVDGSIYDIYSKGAHLAGPFNHGGQYLLMQPFADRIEITSSQAGYTISVAPTGNLIPVVELNSGGTSSGSFLNNIGLVTSGF